MWEGVEISFHMPSLHECQKIKISGRQEKGQHDDWCIIGVINRCYKSRRDGFKMWEGVEISFHMPSLHENGVIYREWMALKSGKV